MDTGCSPLVHTQKKGAVENMLGKKQQTDATPGLLLQMGRLLAIIHQAEPAPGRDWADQFKADLLALAIRKTRRNLERVAVMVELSLADSDGTINDYDLQRAVRTLKEIIGEKEEGVVVNDPLFVGKQVFFRVYEEEKIAYGIIESTVVFSVADSDPYDGWVVKVQPGYQLEAGSDSFILYHGPRYQPEEQIFYQEEEQCFAGTILGPNTRWRGQLGFNIALQRRGEADYRYAVPHTDLSYKR